MAVATSDQLAHTEATASYRYAPAFGSVASWVSGCPAASQARTPPSSTATRSCPRYSRNQKARAADSSVVSAHTTTTSSRRMPAPAIWKAHILVNEARGAGSLS